MRQRAFPAIVGGAAALLVIALLFFTFGPGHASVSLPFVRHITPAATPVIPPSSLPEAALLPQSGEPVGGGLSTADVEKLWAPVVTAAKTGGWTSWGEVWDADTGEVLLSANAGEPHTPASTIKVLTAYYVLSELDPSARLQTGVSLKGSDIYLWGEGDLLLAAGEGKSSQINGYAGIADLAAQSVAALSAQDITSVTLHYQNRLFADPLRNPQWVVQEVENYAGDLAPFALDTGRTAPQAWDFVKDSSAEVAKVFADALSAADITVTKISPGLPPEGAQEIATVESATVFEQVHYMVEQSDNTLAEQYCHLATASTLPVEEVDFEAATSHLETFLEREGVADEKLVVADCSGLDNRSRVTADVLLRGLAGSAEQTDAASSLSRFFPLAGMTGTLSGRFTEEPTRGNVAAKTGSLGSVATLTGVVTTESGQNLIFAIGNDKVPDDGAYETREYLDAFVAALAAS